MTNIIVLTVNKRANKLSKVFRNLDDKLRHGELTKDFDSLDPEDTKRMHLNFQISVCSTKEELFLVPREKPCLVFLLLNNSVCLSREETVLLCAFESFVTKAELVLTQSIVIL
jgi:hypothetical protein